MKLLLMITGIALLAPAGQWQDAMTLTATELRSDPKVGARVVSQLPANTAVKIGERKGAWYAADSGKDNGWLRMLSVRFGTSTVVDGDNGLKKVISLAAGSKATPATGVRGLNRDVVRAANANFAELVKLDSFMVSAEDAAAFARAGGVMAEAGAPK